MSKRYYKLPLQTACFFTKKEHELCDLKESIAHYIHLINTSYFGECVFDESFGCEIWELDFDNLKSGNKLKGLIKESLEKALNSHENRLANSSIEVKIKQEEIFNTQTNNRIKKRVDLIIKGKIKRTSEAFSYVEYFYIGPLSY